MTPYWLVLALLAPAPIPAGEVTLADGVTYRMEIRFIPKDITPPPPPPPPPLRRHVYGVQAEDGTWTREVRSGDVIRLKGEGLGTERRPVFVAGIAADVLTWDAETVQVRVGRADRNEIGPIRIQGQGWEATSPFDVSVQPFGDLPPSPPPPSAVAPVFYRYTGALGEAITIDGKDFGNTPGTVLQTGLPVEVLLWSDTRIVVRSQGGPAFGGTSFAVIRADGKGYYVGMRR